MEDSGKLSPEQVQKLAKTLSEAKNLTLQQEEVIQKVLAGETEIGNTRIAYLERYFDKYSKNLDLIARKHSTLNDTFLVLEKRLSNGYEKLSSDVAKLEQQLSGLQKQGSTSSSDDSADKSKANNASKKTDTETSDKTDSRPVELLADILGEIRELRKYKTNNDGTNDTLQIDRDIENSLGLANTLAERLGALYRQQSDALKQFVPSSDNTPNVPDGDTAAISADVLGVSATNNTTPDTDTSSGAQGVEQEATLQAVENLIDEITRLKLGTESTKTFEDLLATQREATKKAIHGTGEGNSTADVSQTTELMLNGGSEKERADMAELIALQQNAEADRAANVELQKQIADALALLNAESAEANGGILTAEAAAANQEIVKNQFSNTEERIADIKQANARKAADNARATVDAALKEANPGVFEANEKKKAAEAAKLEYEARKKYKRLLTEEEKRDIKKQVDEKYKLEGENLKKLEKQQLAAEQKKYKKEHKEGVKAVDSQIHNAVSGPIDKNNNLLERFNTLKDVAVEAGEGNTGKTAMAGLLVAVKALSDIVAQLNGKIDTIASYKGPIDTRLQGSTNNVKFEKSYWDQLVKDMMSVGAVTPFFKQETFANNIKELVNQGISFDLKQRAFLKTIQEKIANTFDVADGTLLRLIRIQQEDTTAGRLGMESALNSFLNEMYETSEYLSGVAKSVRDSLQEMESLMTSTEATEVEFQVQKWMGSLYSVGMSQEAVTSIANAIGQLAAGQVDALTSGSGAGNLMVMAANESGKSIAEILTKGLNAEETNKLLQSAVNYLAELADSSSDSRVVQQQLANVFGVKASDLRAATNLKESKDGKDSTGAIANKNLTYDNMLKRLNDMANTLYLRTSVGEGLTNIWENAQYSIAGSMASSPTAYFLYKLASLLDGTVGGIPIPFLNIFGFGVDLETTVADLLRVGAISSGILGSLGPMVSGLSSSFNGRAMLEKMGISSGSGLQIIPRGTGAGDGIGALAGGGAQTLSSSGYVGNSNGNDVKDSTIQEAEDDKDQLMVEALEEDAEEHEEAKRRISINSHVVKIYTLLEEVATGKRNLTVKVAGYGLTGGETDKEDPFGITGGSTGTVSPGGAGPTGAGSGGGNSSGNGAYLELGGWTMI